MKEPSVYEKYKDRFYEWLELKIHKFKKMTLKRKIVGLLIILLFFYIAGLAAQLQYIVGTMNLGNVFKGQDISNITFTPNPFVAIPRLVTLGITSTAFGLAVSFIITFVVSLVIYQNRIGIPETITIKRNGQDVNVVIGDTSVTSGHPAFQEDIEKNFLLTYKSEDYSRPIYGRNKEDGRLALAPIPQYSDALLNSIIIGGAGSGKSRSVIVPMIIQLAKSGENMVITDPSSELFAKTFFFLKMCGYTVKVINTKDPTHSDAWNFVKDAGYSFDLALNLAKIIITNATLQDKDTKTDAFWTVCEINLLTSLILYANIKHKEAANMARVMEYVTSDVDDLSEMFKEMNKNTQEERAAYRSFMKFYRMSSVPRAQTHTTLGIHLNLFQDERLLAIMSKDDISILDFLQPKEKKKTALFIITSELQDTYSSIGGTFFDSTINILCDSCVKNNGIAIPNKLNLILDEAMNIGRIQSLGKKLSTVRKYNITIHMAIQNYPQFVLRYGQLEVSEILGNMQDVMILAVSDNDTAEYFSKVFGFMPTYNEQVTRSGFMLWFTASRRTTIQKREIWSVDDLNTLDKRTIIVKQRGTPVAEFEKVDYTELPEIKEIIKNAKGNKAKIEFSINRYPGIDLSDEEFKKIIGEHLILEGKESFKDKKYTPNYTHIPGNQTMTDEEIRENEQRANKLLNLTDSDAKNDNPYFSNFNYYSEYDSVAGPNNEYTVKNEENNSSESFDNNNQPERELEDSYKNTYDTNYGNQEVADDTNSSDSSGKHNDNTQTAQTKKSAADTVKNNNDDYDDDPLFNSGLDKLNIGKRKNTPKQNKKTNQPNQNNQKSQNNKKRVILGLYDNESKARFIGEAKREVVQDSQISIFDNIQKDLNEVNKIPEIKKNVDWPYFLNHYSTLIGNDENNRTRFINKNYPDILNKKVIIVAFKSSDNAIDSILPPNQMRAVGEEIDISLLTARIMKSIYKISNDFYIKGWFMINHKELRNNNAKSATSKIELDDILNIYDFNITLVPIIGKKNHK